MTPFLLWVAIRFRHRRNREGRRGFGFMLNVLPGQSEPAGGPVEEVEVEVARVGHDDAP
jgi:hypothetical protein